MRAEKDGRAATQRAGAGPRGRAPSSWEVPRPLAVILVAAAAFRAVYLYFYAGHSIFYDGMILDSSVYDAWAQDLARGRWVGSEAFYFPPLYPYLLGAFDLLLGHSYTLVYAAQALLGLLSLVLIFRLGAAAFGESAGLWAAAGAALYGPFAFFESKVLATTLGLTLNLVALLLLIRAGSTPEGLRGTAAGGLLRWLAAGAAIGLAATCLPATALLAIFAAAWLSLTALRTRRPIPGRRVDRGGGLERGGAPASGVKAAAALMAGTFLGLSPVLAYNLAVAGDLLPLSGQGGITFYQGNNARAQGLYNPVPGFSGAAERQAEEEKAIAERETGRRNLKRSQVSAHFFRKGLAFIAASPGSWLMLEARKLGALLGDYEASTEYSIYLERRQVPWLRLACLPFAAIAGAGLAGVASSLRERVRGKEAWPRAALLIYTTYAAAVPLMFYVSSRYRLPLVPPLLIYGAWFAATAWRRLREERADDPALLAWPGAALLLALVSFFPLGQPSVTAEANVHYNMGSLLADRGRHEEAIVAYDRALAAWPGNAYALINRGNSLDHLGRVDEALASYHRAEEVDPSFWKAYQAQGIILHRQKRLEEEQEVYRRGLSAGGAEANYLQGTALEDLGSLAEGRKALEDAIRMKPGDPRYYNELGVILEKQGDRAAALQAFRDASRAGPAYARSRYNLGRLLKDEGRLDEAETMLLEAVRIDPRHARAHARLGEIYAQRGDRERARAQFQLALAADPAEATARDGLESLGK